MSTTSPVIGLKPAKRPQRVFNPLLVPPPRKASALNDVVAESVAAPVVEIPESLPVIAREPAPSIPVVPVFVPPTYLPDPLPNPLVSSPEAPQMMEKVNEVVDVEPGLLVESVLAPVLVLEVPPIESPATVIEKPVDAPVIVELALPEILAPVVIQPAPVVDLVPVPVLAPVAASKPLEDPVQVQAPVDTSKRAPEINSIAEIGLFKGLVKGLVNTPQQRIVAVLDMGCTDLAIVCTNEFFGSSAYFTLVAQIKSARFMCNVSSEFRCGEALIKQLWAQPSRKAAQKLTPVINEDNKNLVFYDEVVEQAVKFSASDIHFEITDKDISKIKLRTYGRLKDWRSFPTELMRGGLAAAFSSRGKDGTNSGGVVGFERAFNTITEQIVNGKAYNGRLSGYPLVNGYDVVMRLLESDANTAIPSIESLGYSKYHVEEQILPAIHRNSGMMAIAGSTGSGKSTALRSFIYSLPDRDGLKIYGVEDPVEYLNPFMRQISVQRTSDDPDDVVKAKFMSALRSVLRMDPDVLMLGEVRDKDSASLASEFNRTGHRVFTTVHGDGCVDVLARLVGEEIGIQPSTLAAKKYLSAVMYQKLLPKLCPHCKLPALQFLPQKTINTLRTKFNVDPSTMFVANEKGCTHCRVEALGIAGTKGLTVVAEILTPNAEILEAIRQTNWMLVEELWRSQRTEGFDSPNMAGKTAFEHALFKACDGLCDPNDIEADFESFETYTPYPITQLSNTRMEGLST